MTGQPGSARGGITTGQTTAFGHEQAPQQGAAVYNADGVPVSAVAGGTTGAQHVIGSGSGSSSGTGLKSHIPGSQEHRETQGTGSGFGIGSGSGYSSNTGNQGYGSNTGTGTSASNIGRDAAYGRDSGNTGTNTGFSGGTGNSGYGSSSGNTGSNTGYGSGNTDRDGKPSAGEKLKKLIPGTPEYKAAHGNHGEGHNSGRDTTGIQHASTTLRQLSAAWHAVLLCCGCIPIQLLVSVYAVQLDNLSMLIDRAGWLLNRSHVVHLTKLPTIVPVASSSSIACYLWLQTRFESHCFAV